MAAYDTIKKVKLKDPITVGSSAAILYPVTGINAIFAGTSGDAATTYITGTGSGTQIQPQYLSIINNSTVVDNTYLAFMDNTTGKVIDTYLNFITNDGKIDPAYLPSYVDDVVEVPVVQAPDFAPHPAYSLMIQEGTDGSVKTYTFYKWSSLEAKWVQGGGEQSKIYIADTASGAGDGSIYRCVSGSTTQAIKISENPYIISTTATNGVWLDLTNSTLTAKAQVATAGAPGTVQIDTSAVTATKNVALTISNEGLLGVSVAMAGAVQAGIVFAVGTQADYSAITSAYGDASVVPTAKWTVEMIESGLAGVPPATYETPGIVQPSLAGHITVTSDGVIAVPDAAANTAGAVYLVDTINTAAEGNAGKAVTQAGIVSHVAAALIGYQKALIDGNGISLASNGTIAVDKTGDALGFTSDGQLFVSSATATTMGAVLITGDSSVIATSTAYIDGKPLAVNGVAVKDYVDYRFDNYTPTYAKATLNGSGVVQIRPLASATSNDSSYLVPNAWDVTNTIAGATAAVLYKVAHGLIISGGGIALTPDTEVDPNTLQIGLKLDIADSTPLYFTAETSRLAISAATSDHLGVMLAGTGLAVATGGTVYVPMVDAAAGFDVGSNASKAATVAAIADYVASAVAKGQRPITKGVGITITSGESSDEVSVNYTGAIIASGSAIAVRDASTDSSGVVIMLSDIEADATPAITNQVAHAYAVKTFVENKIDTLTAHSDPIYIVSASDPNSAGSLQIKDAANGQRGVVTLADDATVFGATAYASAVPTVSALTDYLTTALDDYQLTLHEGAAIDIIDGNTVGVLYDTAQMSIDTATSALTISSATAGSLGLMAPGAGLGITAGTVFVQLVTDSASFDVSAEAGKPPTVSALVGYVADELSGYQTTIDSGAAIQIINGNTVAVNYDTTQMSIDTATSALTISSATAGSLGLMAPGAGLDITAGTVFVPMVTDSASFDVAGNADKPPAVSALVGYVADELSGYQKTIDSGAAIQIIEGNTIAVLYNTDQMSIDADTSALTISSAVTGALGLVAPGAGLDINAGTVYVPMVTDSASFDVEADAGKPPTVSAVSGYIDDVLSGYQEKISDGAAIYIIDGSTIEGSTINVLYDTDQMSVDVATNKLTISSAVTGKPGLMEAGDGLVVSEGVVYVPMVTDSASFAVATEAGKPPVVSALVGYLSDTLTTYQKTIDSGAAIQIIEGNTIAVNYNTAQMSIDTATSALTISSAVTGALGLVAPGAGLDINAGTVYVPMVTDSASFDVEADAGKPPTVSAVSGYIDDVLTGYQVTISSGAAISIVDGSTIDVLYDTTQMGIDTETKQLKISSATADSPGIMQVGAGLDVTGYTVYVPLVTDSASFAISSEAGKPPTVGAVSGYIDSTLTGYQTQIVSGSAIQIINGNTVAVNYDTAQMSIDAETSALTINLADSGGSFGLMTPGSGLAVNGGTVYVPLVTDSASFDVASDAGKPPTVSAVSGYIDDVLTGYQTTISSGAATSVTDGTISVLYTTSQMTLTENNHLYISSATSNKLGIVNVPKSSGLVLTDGALTAAIAGATVLGVVKIGSGISASSDGTISVDTGVNDSAVYVTGSAVTDVDLGGVRVVSSGGILVNLGNIYLDSATTKHLGGIKLAGTDTGLGMKADGEILAVQLDTNVMSMTDNQITVKPATTGSAGIVQLLTDASLMGSSSYAGRVPVASAVDAYVSNRIDGARTTLTEGYGIDITGTTTNGAINYLVAADVQAPIKFDGGKIAINVASAAVDGAVGGNALGAVNIYGLGIRSIEDLVDVTNKASIVPTESAVRLAINALPYITYEEVN